MASAQAAINTTRLEHPRLFILKMPPCDAQDSSPMESSESISPNSFSNVTTSSSGLLLNPVGVKAQGEAHQLRNLSTGEILDLRDLCEEDFPERFSDIVERPTELVLAQW